MKPHTQIKNLSSDLSGKIIASAGGGGEVLWMVFTDGTYLFLGGSTFGMRYTDEPFGSWRVEMGLMTQEEYDAERKQQDENAVKYREAGDRKHLAILIEKYGVDGGLPS